MWFFSKKKREIEAAKNEKAVLDIKKKTYTAISKANTNIEKLLERDTTFVILSATRGTKGKKDEDK